MGWRWFTRLGGACCCGEYNGAERFGLERFAAGHHAMQVAAEEYLREDPELIPVPSQALFFDQTRAEIQII
jgi:hypothetical protein